MLLRLADQVDTLQQGMLSARGLCTCLQSLQCISCTQSVDANKCNFADLDLLPLACVLLHRQG